MKFLHTSDLHIGLRLSAQSLDDDISDALDKIVKTAEDEGCSAVIVAGDIYDKSSPSLSAIALFDSFVSSLAKKNIAVIAVSGNHDSAERVAYMSELLSDVGVYFSPVYDGKLRNVTFSDGDERVNFTLMPFIRPSAVRAITGDESITTTEKAVSRVLSDNIPAEDGINIMVAHQYVSGEEEDFVGGVQSVPYSVFEAYDYTALGHLHFAHSVGADTVVYSGSPVKCSFSELGEAKSVSVIEIHAGEVKEKRIPITPLHEMTEIRGSYDELTLHSYTEKINKNDYISAVLTDENDVTDAFFKLRCIYPNLLKLRYDNNRMREMNEIELGYTESEEIDALTPIDVFTELYELQNNVPPSEEALKIADEIMKKCGEGSR